MQKDYSSCFTFLHRTFDMVYGSINFKGVTKKNILSTEIFPDFNHLYSRGDKKNKISKPLTKINSPEPSKESCTMDMVLKFLPEPIHNLNIFHKNYQALYHYDELVMLLT